MKQSVLGFAFPPSYRREDFLISPANEAAYAWIMGWPQAWPSPALNLYGAAGSGKTHLASIWQEQSHAGWLDASQIGSVPTSELLAEHSAWVIEEPSMAGQEVEWFHLLNTAREAGKWLLITSSEPIVRQKLVLADLASRVAAISSVGLGQPDDALLAAVLTKKFSDLQVRVAPDVVQFLVRQMERSFAAAETIVRQLDSAALVEKRNITVTWVRKIMET